MLLSSLKSYKDFKQPENFSADSTKAKDVFFYIMLYDTQYLTLDVPRFDAIKEGNPKFKKPYLDHWELALYKYCILLLLLLLFILAISFINTAAANDVSKRGF